MLERMNKIRRRIRKTQPYWFIGLLSLCTFSLVGCDSETADSSDSSADAPAQVVHAGEPTYVKFCKVCHAQGLNGAPILGNQAMWSPRVAKGRSELVASAINGFGLMPANLGRDPALDEEAIASAVDFMMANAK